MATNLRLGSLVWWRRWSKKEWAVAIIVFFTLTISALTLISNSRTDLADNSPAADDLVDLTLLHNASHRGAFCLDGTVPGYHFQKGFGSGSHNWLLHIEGGGWCNTIESCSLRKMTALGSSNYMERRIHFSGILSRDPSENHDFFNWNKVKIRYCDGASLSGHPESESKNGDKLFFRGQLIWEVLMDELLSIGLSKAKQALLSGCSAGGLATLIHCDDFRKRLPENVTAKCLADAEEGDRHYKRKEKKEKRKKESGRLREWREKWRSGDRGCCSSMIFLASIYRVKSFTAAMKDVLGNRTMRSFYHDVSLLQGVAKSLHKECLAKAEPSEAGFRDSLLMALSDFQKNKEGGMFINSCFAHCQTWMAETWHSLNSPQINKKARRVLSYVLLMEI
ncbi:hypothetical protein L484_021294 [Morus notabilis]|uniref:Pectin acetylesterase n=1 Tax=Morus notabilis TaxID=981085 RepID=W9SIJ3_9ROSA|nr:hypothetical protein L484_021294 [Morus notabilis]